MPTHRSRHRVLKGAGLALTGVLSGCADAGTSSTAATPGSPSRTSQPSADVAKTPPAPTPSSNVRLEPPEYPDRPSPVTAANVGSFAVEYERAYRSNQLLAQSDDIVDLAIELREEPSVTRTDSGYAV